MQIFKNRPLALFGVSVAVLSVLALKFDSMLKVSLSVAFLLLSCLAILLSIRLKMIKKLCFYALSALLGASIALASSFFFFDVHLENLQKDVGKTVMLTGTVLERSASSPFSSSFHVLLDSVNEEETNEKIILECGYLSALQSGDQVRVRATQRAFRSVGEYDEETMSLADGYTRIFVCSRFLDCEIMPEKSRDLRVLLNQWNQKLSVRLADAIGGESGGLTTALLLGNRSFLSADTVLNFRRVGISHMLALSGLHVSILIGFLELIFRKTHVSKQIRAFIVPPALFGYLLLTGMSVSTVRAVLMICALYVGFLLHSDYDSFTALSTILAVLLVVTPYAVLDLSLWLSFLAAASIIVFSPAIRAVKSKIKTWKGCPRLLGRILATAWEAVMVGSVANAALLLISAGIFGEASWMSVPATILLSLPLSLLLILSIPTLLLPQLSFLTVACRFLSDLMLNAAERISDSDGVLLSMNATAERVLLILLTVLIGFLAVFKIKRMILISLIPILMTVVFLISHQITCSQPTLSLADETRGQRFLSEGGAIVAVDASDGFSSDVQALIDHASASRCTEIGDLILTKYDHRRAYFIHSLSERILIRRIRLPIPQQDDEKALAARIRQEAEMHGIEVFFHTENLCVANAEQLLQN